MNKFQSHQEKVLKEWKKIRDNGVDEPMHKFYDRIEKHFTKALSTQREIMEEEKIDFAIDVMESYGHDNGKYYYHRGFSTLEYAMSILVESGIAKKFDKLTKKEISEYRQKLSLLTGKGKE